MQKYSNVTRRASRRGLCKSLAAIACASRFPMVLSATRSSGASLITTLLDEGDELGVNGHAQQSTDNATLNSVATQIRQDIVKLNSLNEPVWWRVPENDRPQTTWIAPQANIDYQHLLALPTPPSSFSLSTAELTLLAERNDFEVGDQPLVLFGLRGAKLASPTGESNDSGWVSSVPLQLQEPDHMHPRCVLGIWDRHGNRLRAFAGSTVPEVSYMYLYVNQILGCNLLPTGLYEYVVGTHRPKSSNPQRNALVLVGKPVVVFRSPNSLTYDVSDRLATWDVGLPGDDIHAAFLDARTDGPFFSSAGCQVVKGTHHGDTSAGPWDRFRDAAGLKSRKQRNFKYMLLTGWEAALASSREPKFMASYRRLRFGSSGNRVAALGEQLGLNSTQLFDTNASLALIRYKQKNSQVEVPIQEVPV